MKKILALFLITFSLNSFASLAFVCRDGKNQHDDNFIILMGQVDGLLSVKNNETGDLDSYDLEPVTERIYKSEKYTVIFGGELYINSAKIVNEDGVIVKTISCHSSSNN